MKKLSLALFVVFILAATAWAIFPPLSTAVTTAGYSAVRLPAGYGCSSFGIAAEDGSSFYVASESDGSDAILWDHGPFAISEKHSPSDAGTVLCYVKGTSSTNIVGFFVW